MKDNSMLRYNSASLKVNIVKTTAIKHKLSTIAMNKINALKQMDFQSLFKYCKAGEGGFNHISLGKIYERISIGT